MKELIEKYRLGDNLTDPELDTLLQHYGMLEQLLKFHGERYHLAWRAIYDDLHQLAGFKKARAENKVTVKKVVK